MDASQIAERNPALPGLEETVFEYGAGGYARVERVRKALMETTPSICAERALLLTESYRKSEGEPFVLRKAKALKNILTYMSIYIEDDQMIVGNQASRNRAAPIFPEYSFEWVVEELDSFDQRSGDVFAIDEETKEKLRGIRSYWKGKTHQEEVYANMTDVNMAGAKAKRDPPRRHFHVRRRTHHSQP